MSSMLLNPNAKFQLTKSADGEIVWIAASLPVRGQETRILEAGREKTPRLFSSLLALAEAAKSDGAAAAAAAGHSLSKNERAWLAARGVFLRDEQISRSVRFERRLTLDGVPRAAIDRARTRANSNASSSSSLRLGGRPDDIALSEDEAQTYEELARGSLWPNDLAEDTRLLWTLADLFVDDAEIASRRAKEQTAIDRAHQSFGHRRYAVLRDLLSPLSLAAFRRYYAGLVREGWLAFDDQQSKRFWVYQEPHARELQRQLTALVARVVGSPVKPSYTYSASYASGASLERHTDREQCEYTLSVQIDFDPEPDEETPWALSLLGHDGAEHHHHLALGDALLFCGRELPHWRDALGEGQTSTSLFLHYVDATFKGSLR